MEESEENDPLPPEDALRRDQTDKHFVVNINNPFRVVNKDRIKEARWRSYNCKEPIPCLLCCQTDCDNCEMPLDKQKTLRDLIDQVSHPTKCNQNDYMYFHNMPPPTYEDNYSIENQNSVWKYCEIDSDDE